MTTVNLIPVETGGFIIDEDTEHERMFLNTICPVCGYNAQVETHRKVVKGKRVCIHYMGIQGTMFMFTDFSK